MVLSHLSTIFLLLFGGTVAPLQDRGCDSLSRSAERDAASVFYFFSFGEEIVGVWHG